MKTKYHRTFHLPYSLTVSADDKRLRDDSQFFGMEVVVTEKMDGENCLEENSIIHTEDGDRTIKWACETKYAGKVLCFNIDLGEEEWKQIKDWHINGKSESWFRIEFEDGRNILITSEHYVWIPLLNCYRKVKNLKAGDDVLLKR